MKRILFIFIALFMLSLVGCRGDTRVTTLSLIEYVGNWHMVGTLDLNLEGREFLHEVDYIVFIREDYITDDQGYTYTVRLNNGVLSLTKDEGFSDRDDYCGFFEGGTDLTYVFPNVNPYFEQAYAGHASAETAVFTEHCNYKTLEIDGTVYLQKLQ